MDPTLAQSFTILQWLALVGAGAIFIGLAVALWRFFAWVDRSLGIRVATFMKSEEGRDQIHERVGEVLDSEVGREHSRRQIAAALDTRAFAERMEEYANAAVKPAFDSFTTEIKGEMRELRSGLDRVVKTLEEDRVERRAESKELRGFAEKIIRLEQQASKNAA